MIPYNIAHQIVADIRNECVHCIARDAQAVHRIEALIDVIRGEGLLGFQALDRVRNSAFAASVPASFAFNSAKSCNSFASFSSVVMLVVLLA